MARIVIKKNISYDDVKKLYYVNMDYGKDLSGKRVKKSKTFKTKKEAEKALKDFEAEKTKRTLIMPDKATLQFWLDYWIKAKSINCADTTLYGYKQIINNHINPFLGHIPLQELTPKNFNEYFTMLKEEKGLDKNTIRKHYDLLLSALKAAENEEKIGKNPLKKIEPPKKNIKEKNYYSIEQMAKLFSLVKGDRMEVVVKLAGYLGLRREEIDGLRWENIDFENQTINIVEARTQAGSEIIQKGTKNTSSHRRLSIPEDLMDVLKELKEKQLTDKELLGTYYNDKGYVMAWENGEPYRPNYLSQLFKELIEDNDMPPIRLHDLRHSFASIANLQGVTIYDIGKILGHSNVTTTAKIYTHVFDVTQRDNINKIFEAVSQNDIAE